MGVVETANTKTIQGHNKGSECPDTKIFELLILKHDLANVNVDYEEKICVIMKYKTITSDGL